MKSQGRGGKRIPGPGKSLGRPPGTTKPDKKKRISVRVPPDIADWFSAFPRNQRAKAVESALRAAMDSGLSIDTL